VRQFPVTGPDRIPVISAEAHDLHAFLHGPGHDFPGLIESWLPETEKNRLGNSLFNRTLPTSHVVHVESMALFERG
jgi:hypothetical protein